MEYLTEDIYGVVDKIDDLNEALGYLLLDESELSDDLVAETKRLREQLKHFQYEFTKAQSQTQEEDVHNILLLSKSSIRSG